MAKTALIVRHRTQPGKRDAVQRVWETYVQPRVRDNPAHEAYYFCFDDEDPDVICAFQLFSDKQSIVDFMAGEWYAEYLGKVSELVVAEPQITSATAVWVKPSRPS